MGVQSVLYPVRSRSATHFREALAGTATTLVPPFAATAMNNLPGVPAIAARQFLIRAIEVVATEDFGPELNFYSRAAGKAPASIDADSFLGRWAFISAQGEQIGGAGLYRYYIDGLAIPYVDLDWVTAGSSSGYPMPNAPNPPTLHVVMQNVDTTAKSAGDPGAVIVTVQLEVAVAIQG